MEIKNARIIDVSLGLEDHDIFTFYITIEGDSIGCCIGGFALDHYDLNTKKRVCGAIGLQCIREIMEVVGVNKWEDLKGQYIRYEYNGLGATVDTIGHIINNKWINIREFLERN